MAIEVEKALEYYCEKCNKTMKGEQFYSSNNLEKYPDGKVKPCKKCITLHVDNFNPDTYLWILQECDVPYVPEEWTKVLLSYTKSGKKIQSTSIVGKYLSKMKLLQYKDFRWKDSNYIQEVNNAKIADTMKRQGYDAQEIDRVIRKGTIEFPLEELRPPAGSFEMVTLEDLAQEHYKAQAPEEDYFTQQNGGADDFVDDLTEEDKKYLRLKWGKTYRPDEWIALEQLYEEMMASYDIQGAGHIDTLKLVCKTSLKANQLIDIGDVEGFQKMSKVYDSLMKSGKFTAAQNKAESGEYIDSIAELVELCEKEGYIERFYVGDPNDKVDITLQDMQRYTKSLIEQETNLSALVEQAVRQNQKEDESDVEDTDDIILDDVGEVEKELSDQDFRDFGDFVESDADVDIDNFLKYANGEDDD